MASPATIARLPSTVAAALDAERVGDPLQVRAQHVLARRPREQVERDVVQHLLLADAPVGLGARLPQTPSDDRHEHRHGRVDEEGRDAPAGLDRERVVRPQEEEVEEQRPERGHHERERAAREGRHQRWQEQHERDGLDAQMIAQHQQADERDREQRQRAGEALEHPPDRLGGDTRHGRRAVARGTLDRDAGGAHGSALGDAPRASARERARPPRRRRAPARRAPAADTERS